MDQSKIGKFIAENRKKKNLTQEALAEKLNISKNAVSKWERGLNLPDTSIMPELCEIIGITLNELFAGEYITNENISEQSEKNILDIVKTGNQKRKKYRIIIAILILITIVAMIFIGRIVLINVGIIPDPNLAYTQRYETGRDNLEGDVDYSKFEGISMDFEIGANKYGYAVFKNPQRAYKRLKKDYADGIKALKKEFNLPPLTVFTLDLYGQYGWQLTQGTAEEKEEAKFVTQFYDIYENSLN